MSENYWNTIGYTKSFEDPFFFEKMEPFLSSDSKIIEYGCGYGRVLTQLHSFGYHNITGFDSSSKMIERGKEMHPNLNLQMIDNSGRIPVENQTIDAAILSTVLCCIVNADEVEQVIREIHRVLKKGGAFYICDFLVTPELQGKYQKGLEQFGEWGVYMTSEGLPVRHYQLEQVKELLKHFNVEWFEEFSFKTMNNNPVRTFHSILLKP